MNPAICGAAGALAIHAARKREEEEARKKSTGKPKSRTYVGKIIIPEMGPEPIASFEVEATNPVEARKYAVELFLEKVEFRISEVD